MVILLLSMVFYCIVCPPPGPVNGVRAQWRAQTFCSAKFWRRGNSLAPSMSNPLGVKHRRRETQKEGHDYVVSFFLVDDTGLEPVTSRTSSGCSYQLS